MEDSQEWLSYDTVSVSENNQEMTERKFIVAD
jgi:hypothetical protein